MVRRRPRGEKGPPAASELLTSAEFHNTIPEEPAGFHLSSAPVAQLDRALASGAKGRRFESCRARQFLKNLQIR